MKTRRDSAFHFAVRISIILLLAGWMASCATNKDLVQLRRDMNKHNDAAESRLSSLEQSVAAVDSLVREQYRLSRSIRALVGAQSQSQRDDIELIAARQDEINYQLRELLEKLEAIQLYGGLETTAPRTSPAVAAAAQPQSNPVQPATPAPTPTPAQPSPQPETPSVDPQKLYDAALSDIRGERYTLAESRFLSFLMQFPKHDLAGNAQYWLGESVYGQGKYELAIKEFEKVLTKYPKSNKVPAAMLKIGFARFELDMNREAMDILNRLIKSHPQSEEADLARERLNTPQAQQTP